MDHNLPALTIIVKWDYDIIIQKTRHTFMMMTHGLGSEQGKQQSEHQARHCSSQVQCLYHIKNTMLTKNVFTNISSFGFCISPAIINLIRWRTLIFQPILLVKLHKISNSFISRICDNIVYVSKLTQIKSWYGSTQAKQMEKPPM